MLSVIKKNTLVYSVLPSYCQIIYSLGKLMKSETGWNFLQQKQINCGPHKTIAIYVRSLMFDQYSSLTLMICHSSFN